MLKKSLLITCCSFALLNATTTMCFKKNHIDPSTIESIPLDGGKCDGKYSIEDMKKQGFSVDDIKITDGDGGFSYLYILKDSSNTKAVAVTPSQDTMIPAGMTVEELREKLKQIDKEDEEKEEAADLEAGKKLYETTCKRCHKDGTIRAYNAARPLLDLTNEEFEVAIRDYQLDFRAGSMSILMKPYANLMNAKDVKNVSAYLDSLKTKK